jgi:hypothetical protein
MRDRRLREGKEVVDLADADGFGSSPRGVGWLVGRPAAAAVIWACENLVSGGLMPGRAALGPFVVGLWVPGRRRQGRSGPALLVGRQPARRSGVKHELESALRETVVLEAPLHLVGAFCVAAAEVRVPG